MRKNLKNNTKWSLQDSNGCFDVLSLLKKRKSKRKYWIHLMLRLCRDEGEFHLIKELRDYPERFKVYYRILMLWYNTRATCKRRPIISMNQLFLNRDWQYAEGMDTHAPNGGIRKVCARHWNQHTIWLYLLRWL